MGLKRSVLAPCNTCFLKAINYIEVQKYLFGINGLKLAQHEQLDEKTIGWVGRDEIEFGDYSTDGVEVRIKKQFYREDKSVLIMYNNPARQGRWKLGRI